jgi:hypothetical protein
MRVATSALILGLAMAGCSTHTSLRIGSGVTSIAPGTSVTSTSAGLSVQSTSTAGALLAIGVLAAATYGSESTSGGIRYRANPILALEPSASRAAPPLDASRRVNEQDCTRPIAEASANLRCR